MHCNDLCTEVSDINGYIELQWNTPAIRGFIAIWSECRLFSSFPHRTLNFMQIQIYTIDMSVESISSQIRLQVWGLMKNWNSTLQIMCFKFDAMLKFDGVKLIQCFKSIEMWAVRIFKINRNARNQFEIGWALQDRNQNKNSIITTPDTHLSTNDMVFNRIATFSTVLFTLHSVFLQFI